MSLSLYAGTISTDENRTINSAKRKSKANEDRDKDEIISLLKQRVIELEQNSNNLIMMNTKYKNLQTLNEGLMEEKLQLQYDIKNIKETLNKQILNLRSENEHLQLVLNDKMIMIKRIIQDNTDLNELVEAKTIDLNGTINQIESLRYSYDQCIREKGDLEKIIQELTDLSNKQKIDLEKINNDHILLSKTFDQQEKRIKLLQDDNEKLNEQFTNLNKEYDTVIETLCQRDESLTQLQGKLSENQRKTNLLESNIKECISQNDFLKKDIIILKTNTENEQHQKNEQEKEMNLLHHALYDLEEQYNQTKEELKKETRTKEKLAKELEGFQKEIKNLENNMLIINQQNEHLINIIEDMKTLDNQVQNELKKRERIELIIQENKEIIQQSIEQNNIPLTSSNQNSLYATNFNYNRDYSINTYNRTYELLGGSNSFNKSILTKPQDLSTNY